MGNRVGFMVPRQDAGPNDARYYIVGECCSAGEGLTPIYVVNIEPYRQACCCCGKVLVEPKTPAWPELYDSPPEPIEVM